MEEPNILEAACNGWKFAGRMRLPRTSAYCSFMKKQPMPIGSTTVLAAGGGAEVDCVGFRRRRHPHVHGENLSNLSMLLGLLYIACEDRGKDHDDALEDGTALVES